jgi:hypothetical protein
MKGEAASLGITADIDEAVERLAEELRRRALNLGASIDIDARALLRTRANLLGFATPGLVSANGHSRLLASRDAWIAMSLARPSDVDILEALTGQPTDDDPWVSLSRSASDADAVEFVARGRLLGLPMTVAERRPPALNAPIELLKRAPAKPRTTLQGLRVADLSSLWAGPLSARLLSDAGAEVIKIESSTRLDGARARPEFYSTLHRADQESMIVDFSNASEIDSLRQTLESADVVIEGSRPRALEQLGLGPDQVTPRRGSVWLSVTGYGRRPPGEEWVAFGDDGAAAGGLLAWSVDGNPSFVGDAIADPLTGLFGALGVVESLLRGGGHLVDVSLQRSSSWVAANARDPFVDDRSP